MHYLGLFCANGETKVVAGVREQINAVLHAIFSVSIEGAASSREVGCKPRIKACIVNTASDAVQTSS